MSIRSATASSEFSDVLDPSGRLNPPPDEHTDAAEAIRDVLGPLGWVDGVLKKFLDFSFIEMLVDAIGMDYGELKNVADTWNNLSWASQDIRDNLAAGHTDLVVYWDGNAAEAFDEYIRLWLTALQQNQLACQTLRDTLVDLSEMIDQFVKTVAGIAEFVVSLLEFPGIAPLKLAWNSKKLIALIDNLLSLKGLLESGIGTAKDLFLLFKDHSVSREIPEVDVTIPSEPYGGPKSPGV